MFTGLLIHLQNFMVNQIHFITFGGGYIWEGRLQVDRPINWVGGGGGGGGWGGPLSILRAR